MSVTITATHPRSLARPGRIEALPLLVGISVCTLPLLHPAGPGNSSLPDVFILASITIGLMWLTRERLSIVFPYAAGVITMMIGGALAATLSDAPLGTSIVLIQDLLLLLWAATLSLARNNIAILRAAVTAWCRFAPAYAFAGVLGYIGGISAISGVVAANGSRASYTFGDPNYAGNYLVISLFVVAAARRPRQLWLRIGSYLVMLTAIVFTTSNGALITLIVGTVCAVALHAYRREGALAGVLTGAVSALLAVLLIGVVVPHVNLDAVREQAAGSVPLLRDSVGRSGSASERATLMQEGYRLYLTGDATGYGPARTKATLTQSQAAYVKEAHNDYLAILLERGLIGCLGLAVLGCAMVRRCAVLIASPVPKGLLDVVPRPWLLAAGLPVTLCSAGFYEVLHFRHLWTWLGLVAAVSLIMHDDTERAREST